MPSCGLPGCKKFSSYNVKASEVKGWHCVPTEKTLHKKWITAIHRQPTPDFPDDFRVCGPHFEKECFERDLKYELMGGKRTFVFKDAGNIRNTRKLKI